MYQNDRQRSKKPIQDLDRLQLQLEINGLRKEAEESKSRIAKLTRKLDEVEVLRRGNDQLNFQLTEVSGHFQTVAAELKNLRDREKRRLEREDKAANEPAPEPVFQKCPSCSTSDYDKAQATKKYSELALANRLLDGNCKKLENQIRAYQKEFLESLGMTGSEITRGSVNQGLTLKIGSLDLSKECECSHLHQFLRTTIENIREEYHKKSEELTSYKAKFQNEMLRCSNLQSEVDALQAERKSAIEGFKKHEGQITYLTNEIIALQKICNRDIQSELERRIATLKSANHSLEKEIKKLTLDYEKQIASLKDNVLTETQRGDHCIAQSIEDRGELEKRWKKVWDDHNNSLARQLTALRANYENPLKSSYSRELGLQRELAELQERYQTSKRGWEEYRKSLVDQVADWKVRFDTKCEMMEEARQHRIDTELILAEKVKELDFCQETVSQGVLERQSLQKKLEAVQNQLREILTPSRLTENGMFFSMSPVISLDGDSLPCENRNWFTLSDFKELKDKMIRDLAHESGSPTPSPRKEVFNAPTPSPPLTLNDILSSIPFRETPPRKTFRDPDPVPFAFIVGKGRETPKKVSSKPQTPTAPTKDRIKSGRQVVQPIQSTSTSSASIASASTVLSNLSPPSLGSSCSSKNL